jgi:hypothetical protein
MSDEHSTAKARAHWIPAPHFFNLNMACVPVSEALGFGCFLVGSALVRRDFRDVDVRAIVSDGEWARLFPGANPHNAFPSPAVVDHVRVDLAVPVAAFWVRRSARR